MFTYVHTQPQGLLLPQIGSYLGILCKVNSSSPHTLAGGQTPRGPGAQGHPFPIAPVQAGPGGQAGGQGRPLAVGEGTAPESLVKLGVGVAAIAVRNWGGETPYPLPPPLDSREGWKLLYFWKQYVFLVQPQLLATKVGRALSPPWDSRTETHRP